MGPDRSTRGGVAPCWNYTSEVAARRGLFRLAAKSEEVFEVDKTDKRAASPS